MEALVKSLSKYWNKEEKCFICTEKDKFWVELLLKRVYNEIEVNPESAKSFDFLGEK